MKILEGKALDNGTEFNAETRQRFADYCKINCTNRKVSF
jgi:hypothetical protein